jgi:prepilin-type N-terminal cleavage/methylation domain-containing protein
MKNAFTLVELLGVIAILSIIALLVTPLISSTISENKEELQEDQAELFIDAAKEYVTSNSFSMLSKAEDDSFSECECYSKDENGKCYDDSFCCEITLKTLKNDGFLDIKLEDKYDGKFVNISFDGSIYSYIYNEPCAE